MMKKLRQEDESDSQKNAEISIEEAELIREFRHLTSEGKIIIEEAKKMLVSNSKYHS